METVRVLCPLCCGNTHLGRLRLGGTEFHTCVSCEFTFVDLKVACEEIYDEGYFTNGPYETDYGLHKEELLEGFRVSLDKMKRLGIQAGSVLDIGCAYGYFLQLCESVGGWVTYGIDVSPYAIGIARANTKAALAVSDIADELPFAGVLFDVVTLFDVMEHLRDPVRSIKNVFRHIELGGVLWICTYHFWEFNEKSIAENPRDVSPPYHCSYFSEHSVRRMLVEIGFREVNVETRGRFGSKMVVVAVK